MKDYRDRTAEFFATVNALQKQRELSAKTASTKTTPLLSEPDKELPRRTQFAMAAQQISRKLCDVCPNLEKLAHLCKSKSLFKDPVQEINALTYTIKQQLTAVTSDLQTLDTWVHEHVGPNKQSQENSDSIVQNLKCELATQTKSFADILSMRTKNMKDLNAHRKEFEAPTDTQLLRKRTVNFSSRLISDTPISEEGHELEEKQSETGRHQQEQQLLQEEMQDDYLVSRAAAMEQIEKTIVELGELYQRFGSLLAMQEEMVIRIDENVDQTLEAVRGGHKELIKYFGTISSGQWLLIKIFIILIFFGVFFITFM